MVKRKLSNIADSMPSWVWI